jgi:hypothetical protein
LVELLDGPAVDELGEDIGQIGLRVDAVKLAGLDQRCEAGPVDSTVVVPDFSFIDDAGNLVIWEHLGRMDSATYRDGWEWKRHWYAQNNFR